MTRSVSVSEAYLRYAELRSCQTAPDHAKTSNLVRELVNDRYKEKFEELRVRSLMRSTRRSTRVPTLKSGVGLHEDVSTAAECSTSTSDDANDSSSELASTTFSTSSGFFRDSPVSDYSLPLYKAKKSDKDDETPVATTSTRTVPTLKSGVVLDEGVFISAESSTPTSESSDDASDSSLKLTSTTFSIPFGSLRHSPVSDYSPPLYKAKKFDKKDETAVATTSTRTVPTLKSGVVLDEGVFISAESSTPTSESSDDSSDSSLKLTSTTFSIPFGSLRHSPVSVYSTPLRKAEEPDEEDEDSVATTTNLCCWKTHQPRITNQSKTWERQKALKREADLIFVEISRRCREAAERRHSDINHHRSLLHVPEASSSVDHILDTIQDIRKDKSLLEMDNSFRNGLIDACRTNKLQIKPSYSLRRAARFLVFNSLKISEIEIESTEKLPPNTRSYTFAIATFEDRLCETDIEERHSERVVFTSELAFERLPYDFEIRLQFFQFRGKDERQSWTRFCERSVERPIKFELIGEVTISRAHLRDGRLFYQHEDARGHLSIEAGVTAQVRSQLKLEEYLYYASNENNSMVGWSCNKRWCELDDTCINMWLCQEMRWKPPVKCIDLTKVECVRRALPHETSRQYSMVIEIVQDFKMKKIYLAHNKEKSIDMWVEIINMVKHATKSFNG